ncbi:MAG: LysM peptidoglycan-binding domain-containing protein [Alistipes sp.]
MRKFILIVALLVCFVPEMIQAVGETKSQTIVYINGAKYYLHTIRQGETVYGLSKIYGVSEAAILQHNSSAAEGLKVDSTLKIPCEATVKTAPESENKLRKTFEIHEVVAGETLYSISRRYEISVATIREDNVNLDPINLSIGERVLIRKKAIGKSDETQTKAEWNSYKDHLNSVAESGVTYHIVQPKETIYALSRQYGMTEAELLEMNPLTGGLRAGTIIKIRDHKTPIMEAQLTAPTMEVIPIQEPVPVPKIQFRTLAPSQTLRVALLLPLSSDTIARNSFIEFYQGFLLGLEDVKHRGISVRVNLFNTGRQMEKVEQIVHQEAFRSAQLIVGPVYEEMLKPVLDYAEEAEIPVVSPLANLTETNSEVLFQMAPQADRKYDKIKELFNDGSHITLIRSTSVDAEWEKEILALLADKEYTTYNYTGVDDLTTLLRQNESNLFIVLADREGSVDRVLVSLASTFTNLTDRGVVVPPFTVLGNARWNHFNSLDRTTFFKDQVVLISTYHAKRDADVIRHFDSRYIRAFGEIPSLYSYRGFDAAVIFCPGMYSDMAHDMAGKCYTPLQTTYSFDQNPGNLTHINQEWVRVNYNNDFTITLD